MRYWGRTSIVAVIAVASLAAQAVCGCPYVAKGPRVVSDNKPACAGSAKCCHKAATATAATSEPAKRGPCERCNYLHRPDGLQPERHSPNDAVHHPFIALAPLPLLGTLVLPETSAGLGLR